MFLFAQRESPPINFTLFYIFIFFLESFQNFEYNNLRRSAKLCLNSSTRWRNNCKHLLCLFSKIEKKEKSQRPIQTSVISRRLSVDNCGKRCFAETFGGPRNENEKKKYSTRIVEGEKAIFGSDLEKKRNKALGCCFVVFSDWSGWQYDKHIRHQKNDLKNINLHFFYVIFLLSNLVTLHLSKLKTVSSTSHRATDTAFGFIRETLEISIKT